MSLSPSVSIILPTFNRQDLIGKSVQSVLDQTFQNFELIIVDDASTDSTDKVIQKFSDSRIIYLKHSINKGGAAARNTGIISAKSEFIAFQDSDDIWLPDKLEKQIVVLKKSSKNIGLVFTQCARRQDDNLRYIPNIQVSSPVSNLFHELLNKNFITLPSVVIKKACLEKVGGFDESLPRFQDWDLFIRLSRHYEFIYLHEPLVTSYFTEGSISSNQQALRKALEIFFHKYEEDYKKDKKLYSSKLISLSCSYLTEDDLINSRKYLFKAFKTSKRPGLLIALLVSFFGTSAAKQYWSFMGANFDL